MEQAIRGQDGFGLYRGYFSPGGQQDLLGEVREIAVRAPFYRPVMPNSGRPFSVRMTCAGPLGWVSDIRGYRYEARHPDGGAPWPPIPPSLLRLWDALTGYPAPPECCLVNFYRGKHARMGLHQDRDEEAMDAPVVSVSLGDTATFRLRMENEKQSRSWRLHSGDVVVLGGKSRRAFHGIDRIFPSSSNLLGEKGGRVNLTLRRVRRPL
ncbi:MAG: alpha-ketoglutarate-dependent dioxygenase AlkB [Hyphomicrobiales bacterium]|nr:alpha-ketoglutarate-dependent dioxygenase AlkB [Hyphomicrobiales bacterium]